jgi:hypothetical protein
MGNQIPETIRAAAYLATRERLDARKTTRNIQCNPPNIRCGNRCIPPTWDCRLKGQGTDPHLRAVKTDPLGGLANIQRGFGRISKGIVKGNFSEVEGGKRAIIRGTVKIAPGNLQQKKELQKKLENRTRAIGIGLAAVTGGLGIHALLMKSNTFGYKYGLGKQINESVHTGVSRVLDATPLLGAQRARTRVGAFSSISEAVTRSARAPQAGPDGLVAGFNSNSPETLRNLQNLNIGDTNRNASSNLAAATRAVNQSTRDSNSTNVYAWNEKHREAFWGAKVGAPDLDSFIAKETAGRIAKANISSFARPAAEDYLVKQYNLPIENGGSNAGVTAIKAALANKLIEEREMHVAYAKQLGLRTASKNKEEVIHPDDVNSYLLRLNKSAGITGSGTASRIVKDNADAHIAKLMEGKSLKERADNIYAEAVFGFDKLYSEVASKVKTVPGAASLSDTRKVAPAIPEGTQSLLASLDRVRVGDMARELQLSRSQIAGEAHAELVRSAYFANRVARSDKTNRATFAITDRVAQNAASELAGRPITQPAEAFRLLQSEYGFSGATRVQSARSSTTTASAPAARTPRSGLGRQAAISALAREIRARAGNEGMSLEAAYRAAKREIEQRGDSRPELVRTATYLAARADFQEGKRLGKPCGASHIPKAHECRKGQGAPTKASTPESGKTIRNRAAIAAAVGVGTALTAGGALAYKNREIVVPEISKRVIKNLSRTEVDAGINRMPKQFQKSVRELVGDAKTSAAYMALKSKGGEVVSVNTKDNFTNWKMKDGTLLSTGSVGETLLIYSTKPQRSIGGAQTYSTQFRVDGEFDAKSASASRNARGVASTVKKMFQAQVDQLPNNSIIYAIPYSNDDKGKKRRSIYEKYGFRSVLSSDERLFAMKRGGSFTRMQDSHIEQIADLIRNDRADAAGKPCGASHIPKKHTCTKAQGAVAASPSTDIKRKAALAAAVVGGALAIGTAGSVAYNLKTLSDPTKSPLDPSPSIKDLVKSMKQEAGTKSASEAMGHYYTKKSGLKPGDVVYYRHEKDPAAHFGIYLGEGKDGIVRAVIANNNKSRFSWTDVAEIGATKPGIKTSQALMPPLVKAPAPKFKQSAGSFSNDEVVRRAIRIANTDYKFSLTKDNCEALANGIAYGVPESEQLQRFRRATRAVMDVGVSRGQRREAREAIYQGRAQGRSYTAREFVTFLEGQREFSSPAGKELAKQYAQYFQNSRLDASTASNGLISPDELWSRIKSYGPALKAQAMADYLLIQRSLLEMQRGPA